MRFTSPKSLAGTCLLGIASLAHAFAQAPQISPGGILNAASWSSPIAPGAIIGIFGANLAPSQQSATAPFPFILNGTSVTINGVPAPLIFVSPAQINAQAPSSLPTTESNIAGVTVVVTNSAGSSAPVPAGLASGYPGIFTADGSGCGHAAALNIRPDGTVSINSPSNSAAPGDYVALFGTGFGLAGQQPADGVAASRPSPVQWIPNLFLDNKPVSSLQYAGLAPSTAGVDQINFQVPASTRNGCSVPVSASQMLGSPAVSISVQSGGGQCTDPPIQSWGAIALRKSVFSGSGSPIPAIESFTAMFPSGPAVQPPTPAQVILAPNYVGNVAAEGGVVIRSDLFIDFRACPVPGYSDLSAGAIQIQPQSGTAVTAQPLALQTGGVTYSQSLPAGFIRSGTYTVTGAPGSPVGLLANLQVGSPIELQTSLPPGTVISSSQPLTIKWTGGDPGTLVRVSLISGQGTFDYTYADAASGGLTISPFCSGNPVSAGGNGVVCSFGLPMSSNAQITVDVLPAPDRVPTVSVPGITGPVQLTWQYSYNFSGLTLGL